MARGLRMLRKYKKNMSSRSYATAIAMLVSAFPVRAWCEDRAAQSAPGNTGRSTQVSGPARPRAASDQVQANRPASPAREQRAARPQVMPAIVIEVGGVVEKAAAGVSVLATDGWTPVHVDEKLEPGTQIRTGLRSYVNLKFGETTVCSVRAATHASIDQFYRSATTEVVRMGLGYGTIRGGSSEGEIKSDVTVDSTVATLAKRGTEGWQIQVEPVTGRFNISLAQYGLVEAIQKLGAQRTMSKSVRPGEYATDRNIANLWINQAIFDRNVNFYDAGSITVTESDALATSTGGYGMISPGGGLSVVDASARLNADWVSQQIARNFPPDRPRPPTVVIPRQPTVISRPEGNFGTGPSFRVLVPTVGTGRTISNVSPVKGRNR